MHYENQTIIFPMGMTLGNSSTTEIDTCHISLSNRRKTLPLKHAIRLNRLTGLNTFYNCRIFMEGTMLNHSKIIPFNIYKAYIVTNGERYLIPDFNNVTHEPVKRSKQK
jgi:hypothetical protein